AIEILEHACKMGSKEAIDKLYLMSYLFSDNEKIKESIKHILYSDMANKPDRKLFLGALLAGGFFLTNAEDTNTKDKQYQSGLKFIQNSYELIKFDNLTLSNQIVLTLLLNAGNLFLLKSIDIDALKIYSKILNICSKLDLRDEMVSIILKEAEYNLEFITRKDEAKSIIDSEIKICAEILKTIPLDFTKLRQSIAKIEKAVKGIKANKGSKEIRTLENANKSYGLLQLIRVLEGSLNEQLDLTLNYEQSVYFKNKYESWKSTLQLSGIAYAKP
ncbi:MAG: hypothetical protein ACK4M7_07415, partial [Burkholderiales bacterium]